MSDKVDAVLRVDVAAFATVESWGGLRRGAARTVSLYVRVVAAAMAASAAAERSAATAAVVASVGPQRAAPSSSNRRRAFE